MFKPLIPEELFRSGKIVVLSEKPPFLDAGRAQLVGQSGSGVVGAMTSGFGCTLCQPFVLLLVAGKGTESDSGKQQKRGYDAFNCGSA